MTTPIQILSHTLKLVTALAVVPIAALAFACKAGPPPPSCPASYKDLPANQQSSLFVECSCPPNAGATGGAVWGAGIYTTDSNVCKAAVHAGAVSASGGAVTVQKAPGCGSYRGTTANGVTTESWGSFDSSFYFAGSGNGSCSGVASASTGQNTFPSPAPVRSVSPTGGPSGFPSARPSPSGSARPR